MASVLKSHDYLQGSNTAHTEVFNFEDVADRAQRYLEMVRHQATELLSQANQDANQLKKQANSEGLQDAERKIQHDAEQLATKLLGERVAAASTNLKQLVTQLEQANHLWLAQWQQETISLAIAMAEKIIHRQIETHTNILSHWLESAVRLAQAGRKLSIRMHPISIQRLGDSLKKTLEPFRNSCDFEIIEDESIQKEGVVVESPDGRIDMQIKTQLARLEEELR